MKKLCILWGLLLGLCIPIIAQNNFKETYKKAHAFTTTNQDSALVWAKKCILLAKNSEQKYQAYYLLAFNAYRMHFYGVALKGYQLASIYAIDSTKKYKSINSLANTHFDAGNLFKANQLNQRSINYFTQFQEWRSLSYAYELKSMVLLKQKDYTALKILQKASKLRKKYAPKEIGYTYRNLATAFAAFNQYDSAMVYQRKAISHYPLKSPDKIAQQKILLAKYLLFANRAQQALLYLKEAQQVNKRPVTELLWCHTLGLYLSQERKNQQAVQTFAHCDSLLQTLLNDAPDLVTRKTISEQALDLYRDVLKLKNLQALDRVRYEGKLKVIQARLEGYHKELTLKDTIHTKGLSGLNSTQKGRSAHFPSYFWWVLLIGIFGLAGFWIWRKTHQTSPDPPSPEMEALVKERQLIQALEEKTGTSLEVDTREMVLLCYRGKSFTQIARDIGVTRDTVRGRFRSLAKKAQIESIKKFVQNFGQGIEK